ncbi:MAG: hypothetical protein WC974_09745 [Thermoplasmata archaeon]
MGDTTTNYKIQQTGGEDVAQAFGKINTELLKSQGIIQKNGEYFQKDAAGGLKRLSASYLEASGIINKTADATSNLHKRMGDFNMVGMNTARLFSDMGYTAQSFSFGVLAIGNNISPLIESLQRARLAGQSFKDILITTFTGTSGVLVGINILVSAITAWSIASSKAKTDTDNITSSLDRMTSSMIKFGEASQFLVKPEDVQTRISQLEELGKKYRSEAERISGGAGAASKGGAFAEWIVNAFSSGKLTDAEKKRLEAVENILTKLKEQRSELEAQLEISQVLKSLGVEEIDKNKIHDEKTKKIKEETKSMGFLVALYGDYLDVVQKAMMLEASGQRARGLKEFQIAGAVAVPNRPDMQMTQKEIEELQDKRIAAITKQYNNVFNTAGKIGNLLQNSFDKTGTGFISQLNEALQIVIQIADIMEMTGLLKMIIGGAATVASAGAGAAVAGVIPGFLPIPRMQQAPTIVNVQLGTATVARVVAQGNQLAQELRY